MCKHYFLFSLLLSSFLSVLPLQVAWAENFDHQAWNHLLKAHVSSINSGISTIVDYDGMAKDHQSLKQYLHALSTVKQSHFDKWQNEEQLAFLINAYNAWTIELILTAWPDVKSIKELGRFFRSPWKKKFIPLLGKTLSLDDIEHGLIRGSGRYNDPRIHFAVNCASIGCPALRSEAFDAGRLNQQLNEQTRLFLSDRKRNRAKVNSMEISSIFKWYREDFEKGWLGYYRLEDFLIEYSDVLKLSNEMIEKLKLKKMKIEFLDYDWLLNSL